MTPLHLLDRITGGRGAKALRYSMVSVVGVCMHQTVLLTAYVAGGMRGVWANVLAASIAAVPAFLLNKRWVWGRGDRARFRAEVLPFWAFTIAGLLLSTLFVALADAWSSSALVVSGASLAGFGVLWVAKFLFLDNLMFAVPAAEVDATTRDAVAAHPA